jgi:hypothetical protein
VKKSLVKLPTGVNFTNTFGADILYKTVFAAFLYLQFGFIIFQQANTGAKAACKMLVKLTR